MNTQRKKTRKNRMGGKLFAIPWKQPRQNIFIHFPTSVTQLYMWGEQPTAWKKSTLCDQDSKNTIKFRICVHCFLTMLYQRFLINLSAAHFFNFLLHLLNNESSFKKNFLITPSLQNITFHPSIKRLLGSRWTVKPFAEGDRSTLQRVRLGTNSSYKAPEILQLVF